jgi:polyisoprenoid-binding protein YceI
VALALCTCVQNRSASVNRISLTSCRHQPDAEHDPLITFHSTKIVQTGPNTLDYVGDFTIRGVTKPEKLTFTLSGKGTGSGEIAGTMAFDRKDYGMNKGIPLVKIADRVEVIVDLKGKRVSGPPLVFKQ